MKTHSDFLAAIAATIGTPAPVNHDVKNRWLISTDYGQLAIFPRFEKSAHIFLQFQDPSTRIEDLGAKVFDGSWNISPVAISCDDGPQSRLSLQRQAAIAELAKRLARAGYVPPVAPLPGNDTGNPDDEPQGEPATGLGGPPITDAEINEITADVLGPWPSFEAQSWACKVTKTVLAARAEQTRIAADYNRVANPVLVPDVVLVNSADQPFPGLRVLEIRATDDGLRVAVELDGFVWDPEVGDFRAWRSKDGTGHIMLGPASVPGQDMVRINEHAVGAQKLDKAAREFVAKVERGEARSKRSYAAFKEALKLIDGAPVSPPAVRRPGVRYFKFARGYDDRYLWCCAPEDFGTPGDPDSWSRNVTKLRPGEECIVSDVTMRDVEECDENGNPLTGGKEGQ